MSLVIFQALYGFFWIVAFFIISYLLVVGAKFIFLAIAELIAKPLVPENKKQPVRKKTVEQPKNTPKPIRSIEINPDEVDRIRFKKSS